VFYLNNKPLAIILCFVFILFSCKNEESTSKEPTKKKVEYDMYQPSEMAGFMNAMYIYNQQLRTKIMKGETPSAMPLDLLKLHSAEMSNGKFRTKNWESFVNVFIESQQTVVDTLSDTSVKERYNAAITNCLNCHKTECVGPIPKIKKLLIQ
jgi:hypothetical protein